MEKLFFLTLMAMLLSLPTLPFLLFGYRAFDLLLRRMHDDHHEQWVAYGKPPGFLFWRSGERATNFLAIHQAFMTWPLFTPSWAREDSLARSLLFRVRLCFFVVLAYGAVFLAVIGWLALRAG